MYSRSIRAGLIAVALVLGAYAIAFAHAALLGADPAPGSRLAASPTRVRLLFSEPLDPKLSQIAIVGSDQKRIALTLSGDPHDVHAIIGDVPPLAADVYHVIWHVVSDDGHPVSGSYVFTVGDSTAVAHAQIENKASRAPAVSTPPATWGPTAFGAPLIPAVLRGLGVGCAMAVAGLLFFVVWMNAGIDSRPARVALAIAVAAPLLLGAHLVAWLVNASPTHSLSAAWLSAALGTSVGRTELWRAGLALAPLWALWLARRPGLALALSVPTIVLSAAAGHSAAIHPGWAIPLKALHLSAVAAWLGGLLWLVVRERDTPGRFAREAEKVSSVALSCVIVVLLSGVAQTALLLHTVDAFYSPYGVVVLAKVVGLLLLIGFGAWHRFSVLPSLAVRADRETAESLRLSVSREIGLFWLVILLGGFLAYLSPPKPANAIGAPHTPAASEISK
jgi:copper transport protein